MVKKISKIVKNKSPASPAKMKIVAIGLFAIMVFISIGTSLEIWRKLGLLMIFGYYFVDSAGKGWLSKRDSETLKFAYFSLFAIPMLYFLTTQLARRNTFSANLMLASFTALVAYFFRLSILLDYGTNVMFGPPLKETSDKKKAIYKKYAKTRIKALRDAIGITIFSILTLWLGNVFFNRNTSAHIFTSVLMALTLTGLVFLRIKFNKHQAAKGGA